MLPGGGTVVAFWGRILALGRWKLQMSWCKCSGVPRGQPLGMAADKCITISTVCFYTGAKLANPVTSSSQNGRARKCLP